MTAHPANSGSFASVPATRSRHLMRIRHGEPAIDRAWRNPYFRWLVHIVAPFALSILLHLGLLGAMALYVVAQPAPRVIEDYRVNIVQTPAASIEAALAWNLPEKTPAELLPVAELSAEQPDAELRQISDDLAMAEVPQGPEFWREGEFGLHGIGAGAGESGTGGGAADFGAGERLGRVRFIGGDIQADKIVFVIDYSGSMIVAAEEIQRALKNAVGGLRPSQSFNVVLFYGMADGTGTDAFSDRLQPATESVRRGFFGWIGRRSPAGGTQPLAALQRALAMKPQAVILMSDGQFEDDVLDAVVQANRLARARIHTVTFDEELLSHNDAVPPPVTEASRRMRRLAEASRGTARVVTGRDLRR